MEKLNFLSHKKATEHMYVITEGYSCVHRFTIGLVVGEEKALVIDAGLGMTPDLREYVEGIVGKGKPIICACTHGHPAHVGSAKLFDAAYLSEKDAGVVRSSGLVTTKRLNALNDYAVNNEIIIDYCNEHYIINSDSDFEYYEDGHIFDLGGVAVKVVELPGHTEGSVMLWCPEERFVFTGDAIGLNTVLTNIDRDGLKTYRDGLEKFIGEISEDTKIYTTHLHMPLEVSVAKGVLKACDEILAGKVEGDLPGETLFRAKTNRPDIRMHYADNSSVMYNTDLLGLPRKTGDDLRFYSHEQVAERIYVITENNSAVHRFTLGLVVGDEKALLIDTGLGLNGQLRRYVESIVGTEKPIIVTCTHSNIDHIGGAFMFDERYLNSRDHYDLPRSVVLERRNSDMKAFSLYNEEVMEYCRVHGEDNSHMTFKDVDEGHNFDLGGIVVEPIRTPGHTPGHLAYFIREEKICFTGDSINVDVHLRRLSDKELGEYADMLRRFLSIVGDDVKLFAGHINRPQDTSIIYDLIDVCTDLAQGKTEGDVPGALIFLEKSGDPSHRMHYRGNVCVMYDRSKFGK